MVYLRVFKRCSEIRFAPFAASSRRLPPPDVLRRFANFAHQAVLHNAYAFEASRLQASALRKAAGTLCPILKKKKRTNSTTKPKKKWKRKKKLKQ